MNYRGNHTPRGGTFGDARRAGEFELFAIVPEYKVTWANAGSPIHDCQIAIENALRNAFFPANAEHERATWALNQELVEVQAAQTVVGARVREAGVDANA